jgi:hypothetical protein
LHSQLFITRAVIHRDSLYKPERDQDGVMIAPPSIVDIPAGQSYSAPLTAGSCASEHGCRPIHTEAGLGYRRIVVSENRGSESLSISDIKRMNGSTTRQRDQTLGGLRRRGGRTRADGRPPLRRASADLERPSGRALWVPRRVTERDRGLSRGLTCNPGPPYAPPYRLYGGF